MTANEMDMSIQTTYADGHWHITVQAWLKTEAACDKAICALEILKPMLRENADNVSAAREALVAEPDAARATITQ